ncbi:conserved protein of unknown function [Rhodovastum atsumiense]|uniref:DUF488 domain-containing protein n=1 Tax=Rhodovastum atsumiense TaxID=504468 RepID=A0A5M6IW17_9PROT|nr:DUF488 domain-containing protein [Rhodovastum atsumiense]KAA5612411.1 DUF488 domain-containing protein [Rhodovastum atsumiense]CAH2600317.1 conserved protein of unknown function [Rhodovastum atsumiense]
MSAPVPVPDLFTIGYEGSTVDRVIAALREAGVTHLVDVRAVPGSRKPGFSRRQLEAAAVEAGLHYTHLRALGTPKPGRDAARRGDAATMHRIFTAHLQAPEAQADLARAAAISAEAPVCLLCFERDHRMCHRDILAGLLRGRSGVVHHLLAEGARQGE